LPRSDIKLLLIAKRGGVSYGSAGIFKINHPCHDLTVNRQFKFLLREHDGDRKPGRKAIGRIQAVDYFNGRIQFQTCKAWNPRDFKPVDRSNHHAGFDGSGHWFFEPAIDRQPERDSGRAEDFNRLEVSPQGAATLQLLAGYISGRLVA